MLPESLFAFRLESLFVSTGIHKQGKIQITNDTDSKLLVSCGAVKAPVLIVQNDNETLTKCADGIVGEILVGGESVSNGYWNNISETEKLFGITFPNDNTQYVRTGDLGFIWNGQLYVCGRIKDLIIINGKNYYPQDIEYIIQETINEVRKGSIVATSMNRNGKEQLAIVCETHLDANSPQLHSLAKQISDEITSSTGLIAQQISLTPPKSVPRTTSGKIMRNKTKIMLGNGELKPIYVLEN